MSKGVKKKGFTLVELVVVLAIFGLLTSITGLGLYSWTRYSINKENNENARTIFLAAQESLTHMQASGTLGELNKDITTDEKNTSKLYKTPYLTDLEEATNSRLYTAFYTAGSKSGIAYKILEPYLSGTGVFEGSIAIEFDPYDCTVYSTFYSSKATSLKYEYATENIINESGEVGIFHRDEGVLKDRLLGFYHATLTDQRPTKGPEVTIVEPDELLNNEDELYLKIEFPEIKNQEEMKKFDYTIEIHDADEGHKNKLLVTLNINGDNAFKETSGILTAQTDYYGITQGNTNVDLPYKIVGSAIYLTLDSIDLKTYSLLNNFKVNNPTTYQDRVNLTPVSNDKNDKNDKNNKTNFSSFSGTYGIMNVFQGLNEINFNTVYSTVKATTDNGKITTNTLISKVHDIWFEDRTFDNDANATIVKISNTRHLFNIAILENLLDSRENNKSNVYNCNYVLVDNIDYMDVADISNPDKYQIYDTSNKNKRPTDVSFLSINNLHSRSSFDGNGDQYSIDNLILKAGDNSVGIFKTNDGVISNVKITDCTLTSTNSYPNNGAGFIVGVNNNKITNSSVSGKFVSSTNFGGIAGINNEMVENCTSSVSGDGNINIGGVVGLNTGNKAKILNCTSDSIVYATAKDSEKLGGVVGSNESSASVEGCTYISPRDLKSIINTLDNNSFSVNSTNKEFRLYGTKVGGIAGNNSGNATVKNCKTQTNNNGYIIGFKSVGGIVGFDDSESQKILSDSFEEGYNQLNVIAAVNLGGVVGDLNKSQEKSITLENWENEGVVIAIKSGENSFAGGLTSWLGKLSTIKNCRVNNDVSDITKLKLIKLSNGDYVGGMVGQNYGKIISTNDISNVVLVGGNNYVGGVVGHSYGAYVDSNSDVGDDRPCQISNQKIVGGLVIGNECVGGLIGLNQKAIKEGDLTSVSDISVVGNNKVGGLIGYNRRNVSSNSNIVHIISSVSGKEDVGGLIGLNDVNVTVSNQLIKVTESITGETRVGGIVGENKGTLNCDGDQQVVIKKVSGNNNVGGLIGKNGTNSRLANVYVNVENVFGNGDNVGGAIGINEGTYETSGPTTIICSVTNNMENGNDTGGVVGKNTGLLKYISVSTEKVFCLGNNVGGIAGSNSGSIEAREDTFSKANVTGKQCVGGIIGYNETNAQVLYHKIKDSIIIGKTEKVGGLAGRNNGLLQFKSHNEELDNNVTIQSNEADYVGGLIGYNDNMASIVYAGLKKGSTVAGKDYVGWLFGYNAGSLKTNSTVSNVVNVTGNNYVGGLVGVNEGGIMNQTVSGGNITGNEYVGGIYGCYKDLNSDSLTINSNIENATITGKNNLGGLIGNIEAKPSSDVTITSNVNSVTVNGENNVGGIIPILESTYNVLNSKIGKINLTVKSGNGGGVTAINNGTILNTTVENSFLYYNATNCSLGSIVGVNEGSINNSNSFNNTIQLIDQTQSLSEQTPSIIGRIAAIDGSVYSINEKRNSISDCKVVNLISEGNALPSIIGLNYNGKNGYYVFDSDNQGSINSAMNESASKKSNVKILAPVLSDENWKIAFRTNATEDWYKATVYGLYVHNGLISQYQLVEKTTDIGTNFERFEEEVYSFSINKVQLEGKQINGFRIIVEHGVSNSEYNLSIPSFADESFYFNVALPDVSYAVSKESDFSFKISFSAKETLDKQYVDNYEIAYKINEDIKTENAASNEITKTFDNTLSGQKVRFAVIAKAKNDTVYDHSDCIWSDEFEIGNAVLSVNETDIESANEAGTASVLNGEEGEDITNENDIQQ